MPKITPNPIFEIGGGEIDRSMVKLRDSLAQLRRLRVSKAYLGHGERILESNKVMKIILNGTVSSGLGEGKFFIQLDWVVEQFMAKMGFVPYPGTLNVDIAESDWYSLLEFVQDGGVRIEPNNKAFCSAICYEALLNGQLSGAVVIPEFTKHPYGRLEIVAPVRIKDTLTIKDGDVVSLTLKK